MALKQLNPKGRIFFLRAFTARLVANSINDKEIKKRIEIEKLKRKYVEPVNEKESHRIGNSIVFNSGEYQKSIMTGNNASKKIPRPTQRFPQRVAKIVSNKRIQAFPKKPLIQNQFPTNQSPQQIPKIQSKAPKPQLPQILPAETSVRPSNSVSEESLKKINHLIQDKSIQMIECPGPKKNVLVRVHSRINTTKITLEDQEIKEIINYFSASAKIPVINGILKAAINDLIISAITSEFVGSRFIIKKKTPYTLIEGVKAS
jgi:hypothetical protein